MSNLSQPFPDSGTYTFGGKGGSPFQDADVVINKGPVSKVEIRHGDRIDNIRLFYGNEGIGDRHGGAGGTVDTWEVPPGEVIVRVEGRSGDRVDALQFFTDHGSFSPRYGGYGGKPFSAAADPGGSLRTVGGNCGAGVDKVSLHFGAPYFVKSVTVDQEALKKAVLASDPEQVANQELTNPGTVNQTVTYTDSAAVTRQNTFTFESGQSLTITSEVSDTAFGAISEKLSLSATASVSEKVATTDTDTQTETWSIPVVVPPKKKIVATTTIYKKKMNIPFTYTVAWYQGTRAKIIKEMTFAGTYQGVGVTNIQHRFDEYPL
jgi:hypothetical protein